MGKRNVGVWFLAGSESFQMAKRAMGVCAFFLTGLECQFYAVGGIAYSIAQHNFLQYCMRRSFTLFYEEFVPIANNWGRLVEHQGSFVGVGHKGINKHALILPWLLDDYRLADRRAGWHANIFFGSYFYHVVYSHYRFCRYRANHDVIIPTLTLCSNQ